MLFRSVSKKNIFEKLLSVNKLSIKFDPRHNFNVANKHSITVEDNEIITNIGEHNFFIRLFVEEWYAIGGTHEILEKDGCVEMSFSRDKKHEFDNTLLLYLKGLLSNTKRIALIPHKAETISELQPYKELICSSEVHRNYFRTDDKNKNKNKSLLIPFFSFKNSDELTVITIESLDVIIDAVWDEKKKTSKEVRREEIEKIYNDLIEMIDNKMQNNIKWTEARERSKESRSFDSSMLSKYNK